MWLCCRLRRDAEWETCVQVADCSWKQIAQPVMKTYTETTDGSTIEDKETALVWNYEDADPDFGSCQAKELHDHLESVLANESVSVKAGMNHVEVKPQVDSPDAHIWCSFCLFTIVIATWPP
jgi:trehalose 6-phosphate synthase/phosphatase